MWAHRFGESPIPFEVGEGLADARMDPDGDPKQWSDEDALPCPMVLADMMVKANVVHATAGQTFIDYFTATRS